MKYALSLSILSLAMLTACADKRPVDVDRTAQRLDEAPLPTAHYPLKATTQTQSIHLRIHPEGISQNQTLALNHVAESATWENDAPIDIEVVTGESPEAIAAGERIVRYLIEAQVYPTHIVQVSDSSQPSDIVSINQITYEAVVYDCNRTWENLSATASNKVYNNYGCAISANMAAQIADPRHLSRPADMTSADGPRRNVVFGKYREGKVTAAETDTNAKGNISNAIK